MNQILMAHVNGRMRKQQMDDYNLMLTIIMVYKEQQWIALQTVQYQ